MLQIHANQPYTDFEKLFLSQRHDLFLSDLIKISKSTRLPVRDSYSERYQISDGISENTFPKVSAYII